MKTEKPYIPQSKRKEFSGQAEREALGFDLVYAVEKYWDKPGTNGRTTFELGPDYWERDKDYFAALRDDAVYQLGCMRATPGEGMPVNEEGWIREAIDKWAFENRTDYQQ